TDEDRHEPDHLVVGEHLRLRQPGQSLGRHAVGTAQVAAVGHRHAQVPRDATMLVGERQSSSRMGHTHQPTSKRLGRNVATDEGARVVRKLLEPKWLGAFALATLFAVACYFLGQWQWSRHEHKADRNATLDRNYAATPVSWQDAVDDDGI